MTRKTRMTSIREKKVENKVFPRLKAIRDVSVTHGDKQSKMNVLAFNYRFWYKFLYYFSRIGLLILTPVIWPIVWIISRRRKKQCPRIKNDLLLHSATQLAHLIRTKQVTCESVIRAYINRAREVNEILNAIVEDRFNQAMEDAIDIDRKLKDNNKTVEEIKLETPLLGVPITIKESIMVEGMSSNVGLYKSNIRCNYDSTVVKQIKNAGGIIIAVTNTPECCLFWETFNTVSGLTKNPYDTTKTVGGSSGGEAALISSGASVIGLGSDLAGSLRLPAFFTGIYSHKPTNQLVHTDGFKPRIEDENILDYLVTGPLTRYAEDLPLIMSVIAPNSKNWEQHIPLQNMKVYYMVKENNALLAKNVDSNIINAMKIFGNHLKGKYGATVQEVEIPHLQYAFPLSLDVLLSINKVESVFTDDNLKFTFGPQFLKFITCRSHSTLYIFFYGLIKWIHELVVTRAPRPKVQKYIEETQTYIEDLLDDDGILLYPTFTSQAHYHYSMFYKVMDFSYVCIFNMLGLPVTNCPAGHINDLPLGFQVVAKRNNDKLTLAVAQECELFFKGWKEPGTINSHNV